jgi:ribosomal protein S18 acetylase RimI-like enzyme
MPTIVIADANLERPEHQRAVVELLDAYARDPKGDDKPLADDVKRELIAGLQRHPTTHVLLAYAGDRPVGVAVCFLGFSTFAARPLLNLHDFAVLAEHRGHGVGRRLMEAVVAKAQELGCCKVTLEVDEHNERARRLYRAAGFGLADRIPQSGLCLFMTKPV